MRDLRVSDILVKFSRNKTYDLVSRVNALVTLVDRGFDLEKSVELVDISDDPLQFAIDSREMVDKIRLSKENKSSLQDNNSPKDETPNKTEESTQPSAVPNVDK